METPPSNWFAKNIQKKNIWRTELASQIQKKVVSKKNSEKIACQGPNGESKVQKTSWTVATNLQGGPAPMNIGAASKGKGKWKGNNKHKGNHDNKAKGVFARTM